MQPLFAENLKWHFLKAQIINLSQKKGDLQKHKNVFNQKILNVAIKETVTLKVDFFKSIKWWRGRNNNHNSNKSEMNHNLDKKDTCPIRIKP